ncbi:ATP-binding protein [Noviherbaspirillum galbum]|uniref:SpoIIE family protein phosphatase n=1 Tax=Noviherbaspirillum galbum TaxID=2709383 RepID=A0A6B3SJC2_9BURK|nr:ATP-binding protein [Noviherbaspirillum galbum]NEX59455.1 SpoIIE family protein phosphatase [Noviherbaspirillum galbum]
METILSANLRQVAVEVADASAVGAARRLAAEAARRAGLTEARAGDVALLATEAATNILKHAGKGEILVRPLGAGASGGVEILAIDSGPGMADPARSMVDGNTTAGSYGIGLGAMRRVANIFDIHTEPGKGTVIAMAVYGDGGTGPAGAVHVGAICVPMPGESACGDAWALAIGPTEAHILVADGLGHGPLAAAASETACDVLAANPGVPPAAAIQDMHLALRATRGAAIGIARIDTIAEEVTFAGVGNIMASIYDGAARRQMVSHNGIVGSNMHKVQEFTHPWNAGSLMLLCSDGIGTRWDLNQYAGLALCQPSVIAGVLYRDFARGRDDATVLVVREHQA